MIMMPPLGFLVKILTSLFAEGKQQTILPKQQVL